MKSYRSSSSFPLTCAESIPAPKYLVALLYSAALLGLPAAHSASVPANSITCSTPSASSGGTANGLIAADTPSADGTRMFAQGSTFSLSFVTAAPSADNVVWSVQDHLGNIRGSGTFAVASGTQTNTLLCSSSAGGYFSVTATLTKAGGTLPRAGTRPTGIATFGILPNVSAVIPPAVFTRLDQHRFGMQGFGNKLSFLSALGISQTIDDRELSWAEPNGPNTWTPSASSLYNAYTSGKIMRLVRLDGIPAWASPTGAKTSGYAPTDLTYYQSYMARVGTETESIRKTYYPNLQKNFYQVTWEPSFNWKDSSAKLLSMYQAVYNGIHSTDPNAVVMGTTNPFPANGLNGTTASLQNLPGLVNYIDGVTTHGYWGGYNNPKHPPEQYATDPNPSNAALSLDRQMQTLRAEMQILKPNMRLWSTEMGVSYDEGSAYGPSFPTANQLYAQAAVGVRGHLIILGEGAQVTYFFYGADYPSEVGFGTFFDNADLQGAYGATNVSPKPEAMAFAALTRIIDGTQTLGRLNGLPSMVYGYAFQRLGAGQVITALWTHNNANWPMSTGVYSPTYSTGYSLTVDGPGTSGTVTVFDIMGNPSQVAYTNGVVNLTLTESPIYVVSSNASVMTAKVTAPVGYTGQ